MIRKARSVGKVIIFTALTVFLIFPAAAEDTNCTTAECHKEFKTMKRIHAPVDDDCTACHIKTGDHQFKFNDKANLCFECHDDKKQGKQIHEVISSGECSQCHTHHGGDYKALLKTKRVDTLCFECHDNAEMEKKFVHGPNAAGNCALCHESHASDHKPLLVESKETICTRCHSDKDYSGEGKHQHSPMKEGCSGCHSPHSSDNKYQLVKPPETICSHCHENITKKVDAVKFKHPVVNEEKKCYNCHDPHGAAYENNLKSSPLNLCLDCHNKPIIGTDGKDYNIYTIVTKNPHKHGPIKDGNCSGCHDPHGSDFYMLLKKYFPQEFYTPYAEEKYASCFECHEKELAKDANTTTRTNFRDGSRNLHHLHINMQKGRTCRACHEIHAGTLPKHIREETPFGKWDIPIEFEISATGGSCAPGCHKAFTYDRNKKE